MRDFKIGDRIIYTGDRANLREIHGKHGTIISFIESAIKEHRGAYVRLDGETKPRDFYLFNMKHENEILTVKSWLTQFRTK